MSTQILDEVGGGTSDLPLVSSTYPNTLGRGTLRTGKESHGRQVPAKSCFPWHGAGMGRQSTKTIEKGRTTASLDARDGLSVDCWPTDRCRLAGGYHRRAPPRKYDMKPGGQTSSLPLSLKFVRFQNLFSATWFGGSWRYALGNRCRDS